MQLTKLLERVTYTLLRGSLDREIEDVLYDSRKAAPGRVFVAIDGFRTDSHRFLPQVAENGISAVVVEKDWEALPAETREALEKSDVTVVKVQAGREALAELSAAFFGYPTEELKVIGITGTKGKTTVSYMLKAILDEAGKKSGLIGTAGALIDQRPLPTKNTTPEPYETQRMARQMREAGCEYLVMEVSSTGLKYHRADAIPFEIGIFTNLSPDHISPLEHPDFEDYLRCKAALFERCRTGIFNRDDEKLPEFLSRSCCKILTYGLGESSYVYPDLSARILARVREAGAIGTRISAGTPEKDYFIGLPGIFNVYNALAAIEATRVLGISEEVIASALSKVKVNGRVEQVWSSGGITVLLDYAHNGSSAKALLEMLKEYAPRRLTLVFGSVGERAQNRRLELGEVCGQMADLCILTADNPGREPVENIIKDIHKGLDPVGGRAVDIPDRREAIRYALKQAEPGDIIAVIGKGHEEYQEIGGEKLPFSDREEILKAAEELGWEKDHV